MGEVREVIRLGYVGAGFMAQKVHLPNFASLANCQVVALAEARQRLGEAVARQFGILKVYRYHTELIADPEVDAVAVSAHFAAQGEIARDALLAGKPVFMEKPMAVSVEQAERILEASQKSGAPLMVAYMKRYDAGYELAKEWIAKFRQTGELGSIKLVRIHYFGGDWICGLDTPFISTDEPVPQPPFVKPSWMHDEHLQRYIGFMQQYVHAFNFARWLLDAGSDAQVIWVDFDDDGYTGVVVLRVAGIRVVLESGSIRHHSWDEHTQVYFERGWVHMWSPPLLLRSQPAKVEIYIGGDRHEYLHPFPKERWSWSYKREAEHFVHCLQTGEPFRSPGEDAIIDVQLCEEVYRRWLRV
ncbi:MAG: Gfo/Idh/MocA family oxidoreductase [Armatimonadota bacterium]|nr:Gfo/Idh/MocA family oxidoreductase [Armatimonadota bacterium]MCX7777783.1 Gfo/Idh/MocA family oxidoreductase [Armatimonadota bacterium]MDW8025330.1 Gfo/Idh/MocA family oxidoreductase [Armatimonadota bacterium]